MVALIELLELLSFALFLFVVSSTYEGLTKFHKNLYNNTIAHQILLLATTELKDKLEPLKAALEKIRIFKMFTEIS